MPRILIVIILFFALFGNSFFMFGVPKQFAIFTEVLVYALIVVSLILRFGRGIPVPHLWYSFFFMLLVSACSIAINDSGAARAIFSLRLLYRFYFFYLGIILLEFNEQDIRNINMLLSTFVIMQLPIVAIKFYFYGISERTIGAYATAGGALTTVLPIVFIFYLAGYYFLYSADAKFIILAILFILFSIVGKKRAVAFLYPIQFLSIYYYIYVKGKRVHFFRKAGMLMMVITAVIVISSSIIYINETLNPEKKVGGTVSYTYTFEFARDYTTGVNARGYTTGRTSTTIKIFETLWDSGLPALFFGYGPGTTTMSIFDSPEDKIQRERFFDRHKIAYGVTPMTRIALEYGVAGIIAFSFILLSFARMSWKYYNYEDNAYWKAFAAGSVGFAFSMIFFFFAYSHIVFFGDTMLALYFYVMAVVYTRSKQIEGVGLSAEMNA
jgi:hypothetical protein